MTAATLTRRGALLFVLDAAADGTLPVDTSVVDGVDVDGMVRACVTARLIYPVGTAVGLVFALSPYAAALRFELAEDDQ